MTIAIDREQGFRNAAPRRKGMPVTLLGFNLLALTAVVGPALLILRSACAAARFTPELLNIVTGLFGVGTAAFALAMLLLARPRERRQGLVLLLPVAFTAFAIALGLLLSAQG